VNPFDLRGPEFLVFYLGLGVVTLGLMWFLRRTNESDSAVAPLLDDYLEIAYLRGGANEALRVATMNLVNRGLIDVKSKDRLQTVDRSARELVVKDTERRILDTFTIPEAATGIFSNRRLRRAATEECRPALVRIGLLPDASQRFARAFLLLTGAFMLGGVAVVKSLVALSRGRSNILLLIVAAVGFGVLLYKVTHPRRTPAGDAVLADLRTLFAGLRTRGRTLVQGVDTQDFALLMAVFGMTAMPPAFSFDRLFPRAKQSSSCGSGCGSSSGGSCGGGSCGGGCGGCGS
jgi:uncharacterized protein (TIGR04222 family)